MLKLYQVLLVWGKHYILNGGNAWESNPAPGSHRDNGFEDRDGHQPRNHSQNCFFFRLLNSNFLAFSAP